MLLVVTMLQLVPHENTIKLHRVCVQACMTGVIQIQDTLSSQAVSKSVGS